MIDSVKDFWHGTPLQLQEEGANIKTYVVGVASFMAFGALLGGAVGAVASLFHRNKTERQADAQLAADQWRTLNQPMIIQTSAPSITSSTTLASQPVLDAYGNTVYAQTPVATTIPTSNTTIIQPPPAYGYGYGSPYYHDHHSDVVGDLLLWNAIGNSFGGGGRY
ncbi:MAG: hypothetical protein ACKO34_01115, partial [Vampirovibrionales bacterium]